ncbi:M14 family metallocarboxypeptidase [Pseudoalteromonas fenneropenaei]|uniref:M14 family metallocarboxypeptidase n=1 Tax=Pseudoalteromonas fenneropenaei TaxID=1737459 RepID=A0ABV7CPT7_9GAMM
MTSSYPIGIAGQPWTTEHKTQWHKAQILHRSYQQQVVEPLLALSEQFCIEQYGELSYQQNYPLYVAFSKNWHSDKPAILVTGGVHGYETSGIHGALAFLQHHASRYEDNFNIVVFPCLSPWGYETINRWNPAALDPNRSFYPQSPAPEAAQFLQTLANKQWQFVMHIDLHETTDTDNSEFRPALAARDGKENHNWNIPDGFYLVGHSEKPQPQFQHAIIAAVAKVTHIAPADENHCLIGVPLEQFGVINYDAGKLGLCMGATNAPYVTTTEVYPDSATATPENCIAGQVAAICGGLDYLLTLQQ